ncbi:MAG: hypothetical protein ABSE64_10185 [Vulcanimicrobiaceae bacterium]
MLVNPWPVNWSAVWVGALTSLAVSVILGLVATVIGVSTAHPFTSFHAVALVDLIAVVVGGFFAFVAGGWAAGKIAGFSHSEPSILHAAISWLLALPLLLLALAAGAGQAFGGWYGGLIGASPLVAAATSATTAPDVVRNTALAALTSILIGLIGAVIGGWLASGEPMTFTHHRARTLTSTERRPI